MNSDQPAENIQSFVLWSRLKVALSFKFFKLRRKNSKEVKFNSFFECICPRVSELMGAFKYAGMSI